MNRDLVLWPESILKLPTLPVTVFDSELKELTLDMFRVIEKYGGVGLAAPQIGVRKSIIVYKYKGQEGVLINPKLTPTPDAKEEETGEGCLSFPGIYVKVKRPNIFDLSWQDEEGEEHEDEFCELTAVIIQHELDHLQGKTIVSYLSNLKRDIVTRKMKKIHQRRKQHLQNLKEPGRPHELRSIIQRRDTGDDILPVREEPTTKT